MAEDYEFGRAEFLAFLPVPLENCRQTHELSHFRDGVVNPSASFGLEVGSIKHSHHEDLEIKLPLERLGDH